ncbi:MAG: hypothetical protein H0Z39_06835 [Peptococcaceae bacterium]|nr:hypothetical protein [Peptococcaceae bacterium]
MKLSSSWELYEVINQLTERVDSLIQDKEELSAQIAKISSEIDTISAKLKEPVNQPLSLGETVNLESLGDSIRKILCGAVTAGKIIEMIANTFLAIADMIFNTLHEQRSAGGNGNQMQTINNVIGQISEVIQDLARSRITARQTG